MYEDSVVEIIHYIDCFLFPPEANWPGPQFKLRSCERWAANEILHHLLECPYTDPEELIQLFSLKMDLYSRCARTHKQNRIFSTARDTAENILLYVKGE